MSKTHDKARLDWLVELTGASAPALAAAFAAAKLAPINGWPIATAVALAASGVFAAAYCAMRVIHAEAQQLSLPDFGGLVLEDILVPAHHDAAAIDELLLDQPVAAAEAEVELLLDDPIPVAAPGSRVVQLFADGRMPSAGQLKDRIDQHLAVGAVPAPAVDASDALSEALAELRRSLRQA